MALETYGGVFFVRVNELGSVALWGEASAVRLDVVVRLCLLAFILCIVVSIIVMRWIPAAVLLWQRRRPGRRR